MLTDYVKTPDKFVLRQDGKCLPEFCFPCACCVHAVKSCLDEPCVVCGYNVMDEMP